MYRGELMLFTGTEDGDIGIYNLKSLSCTRVFKAHYKCVKSVLILNEDLFSSSGDDQQIKIWTTEGELIKTIKMKQNQLSMTKISDNLFASGGVDNKIHILNFYDYKIKKSKSAHSDEILCISKLKNNMIASGGKDKNIKIWILEKQLEKQPEISKYKSWKAHDDWIWCLLSLDSNKLASSGDDCDIKIWNINSTICISILKNAHLDSVYSMINLKINEDDIIFSASQDKNIIGWDYKKNTYFIAGYHTSQINSLLSIQ